jgi:hypothetical protein
MTAELRDEVALFEVLETAAQAIDRPRHHHVGLPLGNVTADARNWRRRLPTARTKKVPQRRLSSCGRRKRPTGRLPAIWSNRSTNLVKSANSRNRSRQFARDSRTG